MQILSGKEVAAHVRGHLKKDIEQIVAKGRRPPGLAVVLVGDDSASQVYVGSKIKACKEAGVQSFEYRLPKNATYLDIQKVLKECIDNDQVDGILVQLPLPPGINTDEVIALIPPEKDADCLTAGNLGRLFKNQHVIAPCTPSGVMEILKYYKHSLEGLNAVVVGRSQIVGLPMAQLMIQANATVTVAHSKTKDLKSLLQKADVVVVAAGRPKFLGRDFFKKDAIVIDVGIHRDENKKLCGDVNTEGLEVKALTPVPGGVGPMTIAMLLHNTWKLYQERTK